MSKLKYYYSFPINLRSTAVATAIQQAPRVKPKRSLRKTMVFSLKKNRLWAQDVNLSKKVEQYR